MPDSGRFGQGSAIYSRNKAVLYSRQFSSGQFSGGAMSEVPRRDILIAAAAFAEASPAEAGDPSFMNNVPDPVASGAELPD
jgi:hypothetical protein